MDEKKITTELYQKIGRFIANNQQLEQLNAKLKVFNPFKVLKVDQYEIRHSNILGWLLNPKENHYLGDQFLKKILAEILCGEVIKQAHSMQITDVVLGNFHDVEIYREWRNIDILVVSKKNGLVLFFENKIHAGLSEHQLQKYIDIVRETYPSFQHIIPVFLTLHADEAPHPEYYSFSHADVLDILKSILEFQHDHMHNKIYDFINYYVQTLEVLTMKDEQLIALCRNIYKNNKEAIDTILKYGMVSTSTLNQAIEASKEDTNSITGHNEDSNFFLNDSEYWFLPDFIKTKLPRLIHKWKSPYPISYFFAADEKKLSLILEVGPIADQELRRRLLQVVSENNSRELFKIGKGEKYTKIRVKSVEVNDWDDIDHIVEKMSTLKNTVFHYDEINQFLLEILAKVDLGNVAGEI